MLKFNNNICWINKYIKKNVTPNKQIFKFQKFLVEQNLQKESSVVIGDDIKFLFSTKKTSLRRPLIHIEI